VPPAECIAIFDGDGTSGQRAFIHRTLLSFTG
jgi:hypothetical protein